MLPCPRAWMWAMFSTGMVPSTWLTTSSTSSRLPHNSWRPEVSMPTRRRAVLDPWEDGELVFVVVPDGLEATDHACEHVGHGFVALPAVGLAVVAGVERDVTGVDGAGGWSVASILASERPVPRCAEQLAVVGPVNVHLKPGLFRKHARLPVLVEVLRLNHADGLRLHGLEAEGDDVVHAFDNGAAFARKRLAVRIPPASHPPSPPKWSPMKNPFRSKCC